MAGRHPFNNAPGTSLEQRAKQRQLQIDKRTAMTSAIAATIARKASSVPMAAPPPPPRHQRDVDGYLAALDALPFHRAGSSDDFAVSAAYRELVRSAVEVMNDGSAQAVMSWPLSQTCPSGVVALIALGSVGSSRLSSKRVTGVVSDSRERAEGVRAVLFPYARSTHAPAREVQVDRERLGTLNFDHLKRVLSENEDPALKDYHQVLSRVRSLNGRATDGRTYAEFEHPILDEIVPHGPPKGDRSSNSELLWRTRGKTDIGKQARSGDADDPSKAHFFVYTIRERDRIGVQLRAILPAPDLMILDLSRAGRGRLGWNWLKRAKEAADCLREIHPDTSILAVTDDDKYGPLKRALCAEVGARYVVMPKTPPQFPPISTTQIVKFIRAPEVAPLRVDFGGGWLDVPRLARDGAYIVNCAISPTVSLREWPYERKAGLGGSGAWALLNGRDGVGSELDLGVGWQDPAVIAETGLCVWRSGQRPVLDSTD